MTNKKYYWLKLKEDFFEEDAIAWIEEQEKGKEYCLFYLKLCLKSLKTNGLLIRNVGSMLIPYDAKSLAKVTNTDLDTVKVAMDIFTRIGLVQILENGEIFISQLQNMVGSETKWAEKKRLQRQKKDNVHLLSQTCPTETEQEIEKETELDIETELEKDIEKEQQHIERKDVADNINLFFPSLNDKDINAIASEFLKTNKDIYYLLEKLILTYDNQNIANKTGYILKALSDDYPLKFCTTLENLILVWEDELYRNENDPTIAKRVEYYKYKLHEN